jgi:hypothetical protein
MKKSVFIFVLLLSILGCKNDSKTEDKTVESQIEDGKTSKQSDGLMLLQGEFVYFADAAVLQTANNTMYAVIVDDKMHELDAMAKPYKKEATDYVTVEIRGKVTPKPIDEEGWPYRVEIKEILKVSQSKTNDNNVIKLE